MRKTLAVVLSIVLSVFFAVGAVEVASRLRLIPCVDNAPNVWEPHRQFGWFHRPGISAWGQGCNRVGIDWRSFVEIDDQGLRDDKPHSYAKPDGVYRVLLIGDSFTEGFTVDLDEHFAPDLERRLTAAAGAPVEVLNSGVSAWGNGQELLYYSLEGSRFSPDLVVLLFNPGNDIGENVPGLGRPEPSLADQPSYSLQAGALKLENFPVRNLRKMPGSDDPLEDFLERRTHFFPALRSLSVNLGKAIGWRPEGRKQPLGKRARERPIAGPPPAAPAEVVAVDARSASAPPTAAAPVPTATPASGVREPPMNLPFAIEKLSPRWEDAWRLTRAIVREMRRQVEAKDTRFAVAIVPSKYSVAGKIRKWNNGQEQVDIDPALPDRRSQQFLESEGIATCPLLPAFRAHFEATGRHGFHRYDIHWNPEGHAIVAEELASCLERLGLVPVRGQAAEKSPGVAS